MTKQFEYEFETIETIHRRCKVVVEAETLEEAMDQIEDYGVWGVGNDVQVVGPELNYHIEECYYVDPRCPGNWTTINPFREDD